MRRLFWWIVAEDGDKGVGIAIPSRRHELFKLTIYHQETLGL